MIAVTLMSYLCWRMVSHKQYNNVLYVSTDKLWSDNSCHYPIFQKNLIRSNILNFRTVMTTRVRVSLLLLIETYLVSSLSLFVVCTLCLLYVLHSYSNHLNRFYSSWRYWTCPTYVAHPEGVKNWNERVRCWSSQGDLHGYCLGKQCRWIGKWTLVERRRTSLQILNATLCKRNR